MSDPFPCVSIIDTAQFRQAFDIEGGQKIAIIVYGPIMLIISIFNLGVLIGVKAFREPPSDIIILANIFAVVKIFTIFITMVYDDINPGGMPDNYGNFCIGTAFIDMMAQIASGLYTLVFCIYYTRKVRNPLKAWTGHNKQMHLICISIVFVITFALYLGKTLGMSPFGYCGLRFTVSSAFVWGSISIVYTFVLIAVSICFLRYIAKIENKSNQAKSYLKYYIFFLVLFCGNQLALASTSIVVSYSCTQQRNKSMFYTAQSTYNICVTCLPLFILVIVLSNEKNRKITVMELFRKVRNKFQRWRLKRVHDKRRKQRTSFVQELDSYRQSIGIELVEFPTLESYLSQLKNKNRACLLSTLLGCLAIHHIQLKNYIKLDIQVRTSAVQEDKQCLFLWNYTEKSHFVLTRQLQQHYFHLFIDKLPNLRMEFTAYAPTILNEFIKMDRIRDIGQRLAPACNYQEIANDSMNSEGGGGRSGQFFFFNHDHTLILKTISPKERQVFCDRIEAFHQHYQEHPMSLIVKLYSVFTVRAQDLEEQIDFSLMGNILGSIDKKYVLRTYDLKGSTHSREVMKGKEVQDQVSKTMKDVDFHRIEQKIWVSKSDSKDIIQIIEKDSLFFKSQGLIDYSLIVIKLDRQSLANDRPDHHILLSSLLYFRSTKEKGVIYCLGIIDYLETWNIRKKGQKWYKSLFNKTDGISSQDPDFYSQRFIKYCQSILSPS